MKTLMEPITEVKTAADGFKSLWVRNALIGHGIVKLDNSLMINSLENPFMLS